MNKFSLFKSSVNSANSKLYNSIATTLMILIIFNIGWQVMFLKLYTHLAVIQNLDETLFDFEFWLLLGNSIIFMLFYCLWLGDKKVKKNFR
jgi:hypothetical protein